MDADTLDGDVGRAVPRLPGPRREPRLIRAAQGVAPRLAVQGKRREALSEQAKNVLAELILAGGEIRHRRAGV